MSLRTRLIVAFLLMSVLPLTAVTLYGYYSSRQAMQRAVQAEAEDTTVALGQRMALVTADLERRVDRIWDMPDMPVRAKASLDAAPETDPAVNVPHQVAGMLGDAATLLDRIEIRPAPAPAAPAAPAPVTAPHARAHPARPAAPPAAPAAPAAVPAPPVPPVPPAPLVIDLNKIVAEATKDDPDARQAAEAAKQWLDRLQVDLGPALKAGLKGTAVGLRIGANELNRIAEAKAQALQEERRTLTERRGRLIDFKVMRNGREVGQVNAELNLNRVLDTVLSISNGAQGEIPFAIDTDKKIYTPRPQDRATIEALDLTGPAAARADRPWIVVKHDDPSGITFGIARPIGASLAEIRRAAIRNLGLGLFVIVFALAGVFPLSSRMTRNLTTLTRGVDRIAAGDLHTRVPVRSRDEFGQLALAFNRMTADLESHQKMLVERERLQRELELCRQIQNDMLPHEMLRLGLTEVNGVSIPAREVGGDFFNYFLLPDGQMALLVGDVSGKGVGAALLMANIQATLRARLPRELDLAALTDAVDRDVERTTPRGVYLTLFVGILDPRQKTLRYVNAGHNPQFLLRRAGGLERLHGTGLPVGLFSGHGYTEKAVQLGDDDLLFFYTDGMVETENETGDMFGTERLEALLEESRDRRVDDLLARIESSVREFRGAAEPFDDATMMALRLGALDMETAPVSM